MANIGIADQSIPLPSQRSVVRAAELAEEINLAYRISLDFDNELLNVWWKLLYLNDFDDWMVTHASTTFGFVWLNMLVKLRNQSFFYSYGNPFGGVIMPEIPEIYRSNLL